VDSFLSHFGGVWEGWKPPPVPTSYDASRDESRSLVVFHHMRVLTADLSRPGDRNRSVPLSFLARDQGWARVLWKKEQLKLLVTESRISGAVRTT
jgi:hypothetical protein